MPAPIAKGLIIFTSVVIAAGFALYQDPVVRAWVDRSRRKIAIALHSLGDEIDSPSPNNPESRQWSHGAQRDEGAARRRRRDEIVRRNRNELIRKAREDGIAVDLDELAAIGRESEDDAAARARRWRDGDNRSDRSKTFDQLVGSDGTLRADTTAAEPSSANDTGLRHRGAGARGLSDGSAFANPFADEEVLFDRDIMENADKPKEQPESRESTQTLEDSTHAWQQQEEERLVDVEPQPVFEMTMVNDSAIPASMSASFHSALSSPSTVSHHSFIPDEHDAPTPTGTLTPVEDGFSTAASMVGSNADDIGAIDLLSDAGLSEASEFSHISGTRTPSSWTDVGSDEGSEDGEHQQH
ncbi:hypothetical protein NA57DRAFT_64179 [Rhizodiscina lignyota]|uniref:Uncharacterized protein n=1 Tax=Rhizodiscina lignyota TaxID=1504668 RepID=A0A9P4MD62_9PEZI|nr:hypothetical protein NA57DRAFT_64179 [Rhizodiscina lignyota]